jgi:hypothetical protein
MRQGKQIYQVAWRPRPVRKIAAETAEWGANSRKMQTIWPDASEDRAAQSPRRRRRTGPPESLAYGCRRRGSGAADPEEVDAGGKPHGAPQQRRRSPAGGFSERRIECSTCPRRPLAGELNKMKLFKCFTFCYLFTKFRKFFRLCQDHYILTNFDIY